MFTFVMGFDGSSSVYTRANNEEDLSALSTQISGKDQFMAHLLEQSAGSSLNTTSNSLQWSWSTPIGLTSNSSAAAADVDLDGQLEIVIGSKNGSLLVISALDGQIENEFIVNSSIESSPSLGKIMSDQNVDIVFGSGNGILYLLNGKNLSVLWSNDYGDSMWSTPVVDDLNADGIPEIIFTITQGVIGKIFAVDGRNGDVVWQHSFNSTSDPFESSPAVADLNLDGIDDVVVGGNDGIIRALNGNDGSLLWKFNTGAGDADASPLITHINSDDYPDVIFGANDGMIWAISGMDGSVIWFTKTVPIYRLDCPAVADLNNDGDLEVIIGGGYGETTYLYVLNINNGSIIWTYSSQGDSVASPTVADMNGDGFLDVIITEPVFGGIVVLSGTNGSLLANFVPASGVQSSPIIVDSDSDGHLEIIVTADLGTLMSFEYSEIGTRVFWQGFSGDQYFHRTKRYLVGRHISHAPIYINGNSEFYSQATLEGWPGDGSPSNPYVIEYLDITGNVPSSGLIVIQNTDVHFVIRDCIIHDNQGRDGAGIILQNVSNARISNVKIFNTNGTGILIFDFNLAPSHNNVIEYSEVYNNAAAFSTWNSYDNLIQHNIFHDSLTADIVVFNENSRRNVFQNNILYHTPYCTMCTFKSVQNIIQNNTFYYSSLDLGEGSNENIVQYNAFLYTNEGLRIWSSNNVIRRNTFIKASSYALRLHGGSQNNIIKENNFISNGVNLASYNSKQAIDQGLNNTFDGNYWDDLVHPDDDGNGIVDLPYLIDPYESNKDNHPRAYPLRNPVLDHIMTEHIVLYPMGIERLSGVITIRWRPAFDSHYHDINYIIYYSQDGGISWNFLAECYNVSFYDWDSTTVENGDSYKLRIVGTDGNFQVVAYSNGKFSINNPRSSATVSSSSTIQNDTNSTTSSVILVTVYTPSGSFLLSLAVMLVVTLSRIWLRPRGKRTSDTHF